MGYGASAFSRGSVAPKRPGLLKKKTSESLGNNSCVQASRATSRALPRIYYDDPLGTERYSGDNDLAEAHSPA